MPRHRRACPTRVGRRYVRTARGSPWWTARRWKPCAKRPRPCGSGRAWCWGARCWGWWRPSATARCGSSTRRTRRPMTSAWRPSSWPCCHQGGVWYRSLTKVLDPHGRSARQVCELYRRRWRSEEAFLLTKRVLDLASLWTGSTNAVQLQLQATLIFYAVLVTICQQGAQALGEPWERMSVEMVFRAFCHCRRAMARGECNELVPFLVEQAKL